MRMLETDAEADDGRTWLEHAAEAARATVAFGMSTDFPSRERNESVAAANSEPEGWGRFFAQQPEEQPGWDAAAYTERFNAALRDTLGEDALRSEVTEAELYQLVIRAVRRGLAAQLGRPDSARGGTPPPRRKKSRGGRARRRRVERE